MYVSRDLELPKSHQCLVAELMDYSRSNESQSPAVRYDLRRRSAQEGKLLLILKRKQGLSIGVPFDLLFVTSFSAVSIACRQIIAPN